MNEFDSLGRRRNVIAAHETAKWLNEKVRPNIAATFTLLPARKIQNGRLQSWVHGDVHEYGWAYENLVHGLSQCHCGKAYRRHGKLVPNYAVMEGDGDIKRYHLHAAFRCPDHVDPDDFVASIHFYAMKKCPWMMADIKVEVITGNWVGYTLKEGSEALLLKGMSF